MTQSLLAGSATADITPEGPQFLFGYPHVERTSTGVHDRLLSSALYLYDGRTPLIIVANDVVALGNDTVRRVRRRIEAETGVPAANILLSASHTHSGPMTLDLLSCAADPVLPRTDPAYVRHLENGMTEAAIDAHRRARAAEVGLAVADGSCVGTNRHDPAGPSNPEVPVLVVRERSGGASIAAMIVYSMHPSVLHEDSTLVSGDFPAMIRRYLQEHVLGTHCPVLCHMGPAGDQSPRHVTRSNTFEEAERLGSLLGQSIERAIDTLAFESEIELGCAQAFVDLPVRTFPSVEQARRRVEAAAERLAELRRSGADRREVRTAECDWFGAEETLTLARAAADGRLGKAVASVMPAEVALMRVGRWAFAGWPGEAFVEFSLRVKTRHPSCYVISLANGELQGYLATEEAERGGWYEAMNSVFTNPQSGELLVERTLELLARP